MPQESTGRPRAAAWTRSWCIRPVTGSSSSSRLPARVRISSWPHDGPKALVSLGGNAEDVAYTVPELAELSPDAATLRVLDGTDHNSVSGEAEFWEALVNGK